MLDPILLSQLHAAATELIGTSVFKITEATNPFTGKAVRLRYPSPRVYIRLAQGEPLLFFFLMDISIAMVHLEKHHRKSTTWLRSSPRE